ncbi:tetratricopeptide repeat protein, partial [bacterium]|nr:tetratricopeptide repeat protein [bacterium]
MRKTVRNVFVLFGLSILLSVCAVADEQEQNPEAIKHYNAGVEFTRAGDYDKAVAEFKMALELDPDDVKIIYGLGLALRLQGQLEESIEYLSKAIEVNPQYIEPYWD